MKKFAIIASVGSYKMKNGRREISCSVESKEFVLDSDDRMELLDKMPKGFEYRDNGKWYSYTIEKRTDARRELKRYGKL